MQEALQSTFNGTQKEPFVIAEMAWSHDGSLEKAKKIIQAAADAKAQAISVHVTDVADYMVRNYGSKAGQTVSSTQDPESIFKYLEKINLKESDWQELFSFAKSLGLSVCAMPNDSKSLALSEKLGADVYVVAAACFAEEDFVIEIAKKQKPVILRVGGALLGEIEGVVNLIRKQGENRIIILQGIQLYPTKVEDLNLNLMPSLQKLFGLPVGLADHIDAESPLAQALPVVALGLGISIFEKHLTHDRSQKGEDIEAALSPDEFKTFVTYLKEGQKALGNSSFQELSVGELKYRAVSRKKMVAAKAIKKDQKIAKEDITFKRSDEGLGADEARRVVGMMAKQDILPDEAITFEKLT